MGKLEVLAMLKWGETGFHALKKEGRGQQSFNLYWGQGAFTKGV